MIGYLQGKILDTDGKKAIVLTDSGIGYEVNYGYFLEANSTTGLFIHHHITDNDASLWGFNSLEDKKMFEFLKTVNKVGSSKAYPLITTLGIEGIIQAIMFDQPNVLSQAPGIGKKMAEQIILSLKDKVENFRVTTLKMDSAESNIEIADSPKENKNKFDTGMMNDVLMALDSLGYKDKEVTDLVKKQLVSGITSSEEIIKNVLREI
jgi:Holliday junction DNA helicase RuvA